MSKFNDILKSAKHREPEVAPEPLAPPAPPTVPLVERRPGRPPGKRSDPGYVQVTAYIPDDLHHNVKLRLLQERKGQEFSALVEELLTAWLKSRG